MELDFLTFPFYDAMPRREKSHLREVWDELELLCDAQRHFGPVLPIGIAADALGLGVQRVRDFIRDGRLVRVEMDGRNFVTEASLKEFAKVERRNGRPGCRPGSAALVEVGHTLTKVRSQFPRSRK